MPRVHVKCLNVDTMEIRLVRLTTAVKAMLINGQVHWARRKRGEFVQRADLLLVEHPDTWAKLLPYFNLDTEKAGGKHGARWETDDK